MRQAGGRHHVGYAYVLKSPFPEQAGSFFDNPFMLCGGLFGGIAEKEDRRKAWPLPDYVISQGYRLDIFGNQKGSA